MCPAENIESKSLQKDQKDPKDQNGDGASARDPLIGSLLSNRYLVQGVLGKGGMGVVYKAQDDQTDRIVAIKMLHAHKVADSEALKRFNREARTVAQVNHHHIVTLFDFGMSKLGQPFLVMEFIEGRSLKDELEALGPLPFDRATIIFDQVLDALEFAHSHDVVHRDLKPENIILSKHGETEDWVKIVDFGLSKLKETDCFAEDVYQITKAGDVCGSPPYMSPEQCLSNAVVDTRSDIYSMGILVYETLSGELPYKAKSAIEMMDCHLYGTPIPFADAAPDLKSCNETTYVITRSMNKEPENRFASCTAFAKELRDALRRDWPKVRSYRFRQEAQGYKDLESEAEALATGEHPALELNQPVPNAVQQILQEMRTETSHFQGPGQGTFIPPQQQEMTGSYRVKPTEAAPNPVQKLLATISSIFGGNQKPSQEEQMEEFRQELGYSNCPFCHAPIKAQLRFCVNCQRQLPSAKEYAKIRVQGGGRLALPRAQRDQAVTGTRRFSNKSKMRSNSMGPGLITQVLTLLLIGLLIYGGIHYSKDPAVQKKIHSMMAALQK